MALGSKRLADGGKAEDESWFDGAVNRQLWSLKVEAPKGCSVRIPHDVRDGTLEKVRSLFQSVKPEDTYRSLEKKHLLDK